MDLYEERKVGEPGMEIDGEGNETDIEAERLARESKILMEIYGAKIKQEIIWMFDSPVQMVDKMPIGAIGEPENLMKVNPFKGGKGMFYNPPVFGGSSDDYGDEDLNENVSGKKYELMGKRRYQIIPSELHKIAIEREYQKFLNSGRPDHDGYLELGGEVYYLKFRQDKFADGKSFL